jgi:hypothetical protein
MNLAGDVVALTQWNATELGKLDDINSRKRKKDVAIHSYY